MTNSNSITDFIKDKVLADKSHQELEAMMLRFTSDEEALSEFCDELELGNWFYEAMLLNNVDIVDVLTDVSAEKADQENDAASERYDAMRDLQMANGW